MKTLFITSEAVPFVATGGLADVAGALPKALCGLGEDCRVVLPYYSSISAALRKTLHKIGQFYVPLGWRQQYCGLYMGEVEGVIYYLLDNEYYFDRPDTYGQYDDGERFAFFSKAVLEMLQYVDFQPEILHCNDWQSAMVPVFLEAFYRKLPNYRHLRTIFTIHNIQYQGRFGKEVGGDLLGLTPAQQSMVEYHGDLNFMKGAIETAGAVTTVSPTYAKEILDPWYGYGLESFLAFHKGKLSGVLNGIDNQLYDPATDTHLYANYTPEELAAKKEGKLRLMADHGLWGGEERMLIGMVTRLTPHKGIDLVRYILNELLCKDVAMIVLGSGESEYEEFFTWAQNQYPGKLAFVRGFIPHLARKIYAGADIFLMPSQSEPCGLAQMVALRYGTLPIVRQTGGLRDSIVDMSQQGGGNGYTFASYNAHDMQGAIERAMGDFAQSEGWKQKVAHAMTCDFSWSSSAKEYIALYQKVLGR